MTKAEREAFKKAYPTKQKITKTDLAKFRYSWDGKPYLVSKGAQSNFQAFAQEISTLWDKGEAERAKLSNPQYFKDTVSLAIMYNQVGVIVSDQPWYTGSFRANVVTYSIAMLKCLLESQYPEYALNFDIIWRNQDLPPLLKKIFVTLTRLVYEEIVNDRSGVTNFTQRCKQKNFWESMPTHVSLELSVFGDVKRLLVTHAVKTRTEKQAQKVGRLLSSVELQRFVVEKGAAFWSEVRQFAYENKKVGLLPKEQSALTTATRGGVPSEFACKALFGLYRRCQENGFRG